MTDHQLIATINSNCASRIFPMLTLKQLIRISGARRFRASVLDHEKPRYPEIKVTMDGKKTVGLNYDAYVQKNSLYDEDHWAAFLETGAADVILQSWEYCFTDQFIAAHFNLKADALIVAHFKSMPISKRPFKNATDYVKKLYKLHEYQRTDLKMLNIGCSQLDSFDFLYNRRNGVTTKIPATDVGLKILERTMMQLNEEKWPKPDTIRHKGKLQRIPAWQFLEYEENEFKEMCVIDPR